MSSGVFPLPNAGVSFRYFSRGYSGSNPMGSASAAAGSIPLRLTIHSKTTYRHSTDRLIRTLVARAVQTVAMFRSIHKVCLRQRPRPCPCRRSGGSGCRRSPLRTQVHVPLCRRKVARTCEFLNRAGRPICASPGAYRTYAATCAYRHRSPIRAIQHALGAQSTLVPKCLLYQRLPAPACDRGG
jgi:hypothetical protein